VGQAIGGTACLSFQVVGECRATSWNRMAGISNPHEDSGLISSSGRFFFFLNKVRSRKPRSVWGHTVFKSQGKGWGQRSGPAVASGPVLPQTLCGSRAHSLDHSFIHSSNTDTFLSLVLRWTVGARSEPTAWRFTSVIPVLRRQRQWECRLKASMDYIA
jgi:hypothetical protein